MLNFNAMALSKCIGQFKDIRAEGSAAASCLLACLLCPVVPWACLMGSCVAEGGEERKHSSRDDRGHENHPPDRV